MRVHGVDVDKHLEKLRETDKLSATILEEVIAENERIKRHVGIIAEQAQGYFEDTQALRKIINDMKGFTK